MRRRPRLPNGELGPMEPLFGDLSPEEKIEMLAVENSTLVYESMMKDAQLAEMEATQAEIIYALMNGGML